ncbi:MerR family transcriptional regulator [Methylibium rhizosphaerae]|uniref:MerR family transcriptional regulator n=1 Tax=Methylibium rhizosphaerae TaxID=2570323 RepID=UPI001C6155E3|nr:MerR family transcriptional regulator [Methylibium rhizosphaerae]
MNLQQHLKVKRHMRIGELAQATGLRTSGIRFYEAQGLLPAPARRGNGYRDYPASTVTTLQMIQQAQRFGFSLAEIRSAMRAAVPAGRNCTRFLDMLRAKLAETDRHLEQMKQARRQLAQQIRVLERKGGTSDGGVAA